LKISIAYTFVTHGSHSEDFAARFVGTYHEFPPGIEHETTVICKGGPLPLEKAMLFATIPCTFFPHPNEDGGFDVSGYQALIPRLDADMVLACGESVYFHRSGWLKRLADVWQSNGPGMYGLFATHAVRAHLNTTAFAISPKLMSLYPEVARTRNDRYNFEHGERALWRRVAARGMPARFVTWDGVWRPGEWRAPANILWRGDQSNCLAFCNHSQRWAEADPVTQRNWAYSADRPYK